MIQKKIHRGVFAVMDGTFAGDGPGPRCMIPHVKNVILASRRSGRDRRGRGEAHGHGSDGATASSSASRTSRASAAATRATSRSSATSTPAKENWHFDGPFKEMTFASKNQHRIYWGPLKKPVEWSLKTWLAPWAYVASVAYHDMFWYPRFAKEKMAPVLESDWGKLFANWGKVPEQRARLPGRRRGEPRAHRARREALRRGHAPHRHGRRRVAGDERAQAPQAGRRLQVDVLLSDLRLG